MFENKNFKLELLTRKTESSKEVDINLPDIELQTPVLPDIKVSAPKNPSVTVKKPSVSMKIVDIKPIPVETKQEKVTKKEIVKAEKVSIEKSKSNQLPNNSNLQQKEQIVSTPQQIEIKPQKQEINTPVYTEQELEVIAWNKWRSDLQNKLMKDSKISAPLGTTFFYSFTVDKFGNITNLKTWSDNPSYTQLAVRIIKPLLLSYQHTDILTFPQNSKRIVTNADGSFTMAYSSKYSSPSDYNDYERIEK
ncbi:MAG: hypothetical protein ACI37T_04575 [Candidatus Gastranaerophilaceae bacterium]